VRRETEKRGLESETTCALYGMHCLERPENDSAKLFDRQRPWELGKPRESIAILGSGRTWR